MPVIILSPLGCTPITSNFDEARGKLQVYDYMQAINLYRLDEARDDEHFVLYNLHLGAAGMQAGDYFDAERALKNSVKVMISDVGKERGALSLISSERIKVFKGEPFEKAMAYFYLGIIYYNRGDYENARAAFNSALLMDKQSEEGYRDDLRLIYFMLAKTLLKLKDNDNARIAMNKAKRRNAKEPYPPNPFYDLKLAGAANLTVLVELGHAPKKIRRGPGQSLDDFRQRPYPEKMVKLSLDGQPLGEAVSALKLIYEANHRGSSGKDAVQASKGVANQAALITAIVSDDDDVQLAALLFALANDSSADIRQWATLPAEIQVISAVVKLPPGVTSQLKTLVLDFFGPTQMALPNYRQVWYYLPIYSGAGAGTEREQIYLFRSGEFKGNGAYLRN